MGLLPKTPAEPRPAPTRVEEAQRLIDQAKELIKQHFCDAHIQAGSHIATDTLVFGYLMGVMKAAPTLFERNCALEGIRLYFGWDDEYIATQIIGG